MFEEAGGEAERAKLMAEIQKEKDREANKINQTEPSKTKRSDIASNGNVMVESIMKDRDPHKDDKYYWRNPGYKCGKGSSGVVVVAIKINKNGDVTSASYDPSQSSGANPCMIEQAVKYANMSRYKFSSSAPASQSGFMVYRFISQ